MKICFCSLIYHNEEEVLSNSKSKTLPGMHKLCVNLLKGFEQQPNVEVTVLNSTDIPAYPRYKKIIVKGTKWSHKNGAVDFDIGMLNISGIKYVTETVNLIKKLRLWVKENAGHDLAIFAYGRKLPHVIAINYIKKKYPNVITCMMLGDLSGQLTCSVSIGNRSKLITYLANKLLDYQVTRSTEFDTMVLMTHQMASVLKIDQKPLIIVEGVYSDDYASSTNPLKPTEKKIILYTGSLELQYGIMNLIDAVSSIHDPDYELWLYGGGNADSQINQICNSDSRIKFFGMVPSSEISRIQQQATVLLNPRQNIGEYTKYSFPSKTMEYLASGKPVIGYKLDGFPDEYDEYIQYVTDNSVEALRDKIVEICSMSDDERNAIGEKSRKFILEQKNPRVQCEKIVKMIKSIIGETS